MQHLEYHTSSLAVQFSGNAKVYYYLCNAGEWTLALAALDAKKELRAVVPGKIKDDRVSLSIANVIGVHVVAHAEAVLPITALILPDALVLAKLSVAYNDQKVAAGLDAQGAVQ